MSRHWFKPKRYGLGASPASWQGWALTIGYVLIITGLGVWLGAQEADAERHLTAFIALSAAVTIIFVGIAWRTTEGGWRWRWGDDK